MVQVDDEVIGTKMFVGPVRKLKEFWSIKATEWGRGCENKTKWPSFEDKPPWKAQNLCECRTLRIVKRKYKRKVHKSTRTHTNCNELKWRCSGTSCKLSVSCQWIAILVGRKEGHTQALNNYTFWAKWKLSLHASNFGYSDKIWLLIVENLYSLNSWTSENKVSGL